MKLTKAVLLITVVLFVSCKSKTEKEYLSEIITLINSGDCTKAAEVASQAIKDYPTNPELFYNRGWCRMRNDLKNAFEDFIDCLRVDPKNSNCHKGLATIYAIQGKYEHAEKYFIRAIGLTSDKERKAVIYSNIAKMNLDYKQDYDEAVKYFRKAIDLADRGDFYYGLGTAYFNKKQKHRAVETWRKAAANKEFREDQFEHKIYHRLALHYSGSKQYAEALKYVNMAVELAPNNNVYQKMKKNIEKRIK